MRSGGQIPWNAIPICETLRISCLMGRPHTKDVLENPFKDQLSRLVHWLSSTLSLRRTSQESISFEREYYLEYSLDTLCTREESGRVTEWLQTSRSWKRWTHRKSTQKEFIFPVADGRIKFVGGDQEQNIHLDTESPTSRRRSKRFSRRIRRVSTSTTSRLTSG